MTPGEGEQYCWMITSILSEPSDDDYSSRCRRWWLLVATVSGLQTHAGFNSPLSFQIGSNVHNVHTEQSPVSSLLVATFLPVKFTLWKSGATKTKRGAKCQMSQTQIKYFQALLNQYLTFLRAVFRLSDILSVGVENWRVDIYGPFENNFQNKKFYFRSKHRKKQTSCRGGGVTLLGPNCTMEVVALVTFNVPRFVLPKLFAC